MFKRLFARPLPDLRRLVENGVLIVDVRTPKEFNEGHLAGTINIPLDRFYRALEDLKIKNKPIITVCNTGTRSKMASGALKKMANGNNLRIL